MKNKNLVYILLPAVLLIWGMIVFQIIDGLPEEPENETNRISPGKNFSVEMVSTDSFQLTLVYNDPFLGKNLSVSPNEKYVFKNTSPLKAATSFIPDKKKEVTFPSIKYLGIVENKQKGKKIALLNINAVSYMAVEKEKYDGVEVLKVFRDSVLIRFSNQSKYIIR